MGAACLDGGVGLEGFGGKAGLDVFLPSPLLEP